MVVLFFFFFFFFLREILDKKFAVLMYIAECLTRSRAHNDADCNIAWWSKNQSKQATNP
jgi:hypothetical protein